MHAQHTSLSYTAALEKDGTERQPSNLFVLQSARYCSGTQSDIGQLALFQKCKWFVVGFNDKLSPEEVSTELAVYLLLIC